MSDAYEAYLRSAGGRTQSAAQTMGSGTSGNEDSVEGPIVANQERIDARRAALDAANAAAAQKATAPQLLSPTAAPAPKPTVATITAAPTTATKPVIAPQPIVGDPALAAQLKNEALNQAGATYQTAQQQLVNATDPAAQAAALAAMQKADQTVGGTSGIAPEKIMAGEQINAATGQNQVVPPVTTAREEAETPLPSVPPAETPTATETPSAGESTGPSAEEKAMKAAETAAFGAQNRAMGAAQAGGLSAAAGANAGAQAGTQAYTETYPQMALGYGQQDVEKWLGSLDAKTKTELAKMGIDFEKLKADAAQGGAMWQGVAAFLPSVLPYILSDKTKKTEIRDANGLVDSVADVVRGKYYEYKGKPGKGEVGVMAQDLEKTPLASAVKDTPNGKMVDTQRLTMGNTAMISELAQKLDKALSYLGRVK